MHQQKFSKIWSEKSLQEEYRADCRICLQPIMSDDSYCDCKGLSRYVHQDCLVSWIKTQKSNKKQDRLSATCEICKGEISLEMQRKCKTRKLQDTCRNLFCSQNGFKKLSSGGLLLLYMIMIGLLVLMVDNYQSEEDETYLIISIIIGIILLAFLLCFCLKTFTFTEWEIVAAIPREKTKTRINYHPISV